MNQKVLLNIIVQMIRSGIILGLSLITSRVILKALGEDDFGLYCLLSGFIVFFAFIQSSLSTSIQRFLAYNLGKGNIAECKGYLISGYALYIIGGFFLCFLCYLICMIFFNEIFQVDPQKESLARVVLLIVVLSFYVELIQTPTYSILYARECFTVISAIHVFDAFIKFGGALLLLHAEPHDRLFLYSVLIMSISITKGLLYLLFSCRFEEVRGLKMNMLSYGKFKNIFSLSGYVVFSLVGRMGRLQGITLIINHVYGVKVNGSWGIAQQVGSAARNFATPVHSAFDPLIIKREGRNNRTDVIRLSLFCSKIGFLLFSAMALPLVFNINWILNTWLKTPPPFSSILCVMFIVGILVEQITFGLSSAFLAVGKVKVVFVVIGLIRLLSIPIMYFPIRFGGSLILFSAIYCFLELICSMFYIFYFIIITGSSLYAVLYGFLLKEFVVFASMAFACYVVSLLEGSLIVFVASALLTFATCLLFSWLCGLTSDEKSEIISIYLSLKSKLHKN